MKKISVLIVDDSDLDCYLLERELSKTRYECSVCKKSNGEEALTFFQQYHANKEQFGDDFPPLVMFLDINMPLMNGLEFLHEYNALLKSTELGTTVVMMFTSSKNPKDIEASLDYEFVDGYLVKGEYEIADLEQVFERLAA